MSGPIPRKIHIPHWGWLLSVTVLIVLMFNGIRFGLCNYRERRALAAITQSGGLFSRTAADLCVERRSWQPSGLCDFETSIGASWLIAMTMRTVRIEAAGSMVDDQHLRSIAALTGLERLKLCDTRITDIGLMRLGSLANLKTVELPGAQITDAGLVHFGHLGKLRYVDLRRTQVTDSGIAKLKSVLPNCKIEGP